MTIANLQDRTRARIENLFWLDEQEATIDEVDQRLGIPSETLHSWCLRNGLEDLYKRFLHRSHVCSHNCPDRLPDRPDPVLFLGIHNRVIPPRDQRDWVTSVELQHEAGISYRQLDYWCRTGLLTTLGDNNEPGSGSARAFHEHQATRATRVRELLDAGVAMQTIRQHVDDYLATSQIQIGPITITRNTEHDQPQEAPA